MTDATVLAQWDGVDVPQKGFFEIYYDVTNHALSDVAANATKAGESRGFQFVIDSLARETTYFVWVRYRQDSANFGAWYGPTSTTTSAGLDLSGKVDKANLPDLGTSGLSTIENIEAAVNAINAVLRP